MNILRMDEIKIVYKQYLDQKHSVIIPEE